MDPSTVADLARRLSQVRDEISHLKQVESDLVTELSELVPAGPEIVPDVKIGGEWRIETHGGTDRSGWQSEKILARLAAQTSVDADGVRLSDAEARQALYEAIAECVPVTASLQWRVTALRRWGINPDEYAESKPGRTTVQVIYQAPPAGASEHDQW